MKIGIITDDITSFPKCTTNISMQLCMDGVLPLEYVASRNKFYLQSNLYNFHVNGLKETFDHTFIISGLNYILFPNITLENYLEQISYVFKLTASVSEKITFVMSFSKFENPSYKKRSRLFEKQLYDILPPKVEINVKRVYVDLDDNYLLHSNIEKYCDTIEDIISENSILLGR